MDNLPPINPRREALAQACRALRDKCNKIRVQYEAQPEFEEIKSEYDKIIRDLEAEIIQIDHVEYEKYKEAKAAR